MDELPGPVRAEVRMDDGVPVGQAALDAVDHRRRHELIGLAPGIGRLDRRGRRRRVMRRLGVDDRVVAAFRAIPALVAVHREVPAADARDRRLRVGRRQAGLKVDREAERRRGRRVASIEQGVDGDARHAFALGEVRQRDEMPVVGVDPARPDEADHVQDAASLAGPGARLEEGRALEERPVRDGRVDARQVLEHGSAGPEVEMADLRVAHLSGRQPDVASPTRRAARAATARAGRARSASGRPRWHRRTGPGRSRTRRARRGRSAVAGPGGRRSPGGAAGAGGQSRPGPRSRPSRRA